MKWLWSQNPVSVAISATVAVVVSKDSRARLRRRRGGVSAGRGVPDPSGIELKDVEGRLLVSANPQTLPFVPEAFSPSKYLRCSLGHLPVMRNVAFAKVVGFLKPQRLAISFAESFDVPRSLMALPIRMRSISSRIVRPADC